MAEWTDWHERHSDKIEMVAGIDCWIWTAGTNKAKTHGRVCFRNPDGKRYAEYAHRAAFMSNKGSHEINGIICHKCGVGLCVRPSHLYDGTHASNGKDMADMGTGLAMISYKDAYDLRVMYRDGAKLQDIADKYGLAFGTVYPIVMGRAYRHAPFPENYTFGNRARKPLTAEELLDIRAMLARGDTQSSIAEKHGIAQSIISRINTGARHRQK